MRIVTVIDVLSSGGAQRQIVNLSKGLSANGHNVTLFYARDQRWRLDELHDAGVETVNITSKNPLLFIWGLIKIIKLRNVDVLISFLTSTSILTVIAYLFSSRKPKLIVSERNALAGSLTPFRLKVALFLYRYSDFVVTNANHARKEIEDYSSTIAKKTRTIWNGVDLSRLDLVPTKKRSNPIQLLAMGTLDPFKGQSVLVEALSILKSRHNLHVDVTWAVRRSNNLMPHEIKHKEALDFRLSELKLTDQWRWLDEQEDVIAILNNCDFLAHPSIRDGLPNSVCEALAAGKPVIAADILDGPQLLNEGRNGFLFEAENPESLADALLKAANMTDEEFFLMSIAAKEFAKDRLSTGSLVSNYEALIS